jgi:hypothetical protein
MQFMCSSWTKISCTFVFDIAHLSATSRTVKRLSPSITSRISFFHGFTTMTRKQSNNQVNGKMSTLLWFKTSTVQPIFSSDNILGTHRAQMWFMCSSWTKISCTVVFDIAHLWAKIDLLEFQCLKHPPYSPDLAPMDFAVFPYTKYEAVRKVCGQSL